MDINTYGGLPGQGALVQTTEAQVWSGRETDQIFGTLPILAATVDAGNTPTTSLRPGLVLGRITASGLLTAYNPDAVDGSEVAYAVLAHGISMLNAAAVAEIKQGHVLLGGILKAASLITGQDGGLDAQARRQLLVSGRFLFDDDLWGRQAGIIHEVAAAGPTKTVVASEAGTLFVATGACAFTLPAIAGGLGPFEFMNSVDANMSIESAEGDNIIWLHDSSVDSLAFSTASQKIGGRLEFQANSAGTKWLVRNFSPSTATVTAAT